MRISDWSSDVYSSDLISGLMNYVYEDDYAPLVTLTVPPKCAPGDRLPIRVRSDWLSCTHESCFPEGDDLSLDLIVWAGEIDAKERVAFDGFRARLPRPLGSEGRFARVGDRLRLAIPFPAGASIATPYFFPTTEGAIRYASPQSVTRSGDWLIVETDAAESPPSELHGVIKTGPHKGLILTAKPGEVPSAGTPIADVGQPADQEAVSFSDIVLTLAGALVGGLLLNIMPCVFPILSLKALKLAKAGGDEHVVRRDALAYTAGIVLTCLALGRSEEHTSELQSLMRISYAVFCLKQKTLPRQYESVL